MNRSIGFIIKKWILIVFNRLQIIIFVGCHLYSELQYADAKIQYCIVFSKLIMNIFDNSFLKKNEQLE